MPRKDRNETRISWLYFFEILAKQRETPRRPPLNLNEIRLAENTRHLGLDEKKKKTEDYFNNTSANGFTLFFES
jgi:hypothetical protein